MRTDSTNLSADALESCRGHVRDRFGADYLPDEPRRYAASDAAQEAHEAIRPSNVGTQAAMLDGIDPDGVRLYDLIWRQFVACQMTDARYLSTTITIEAGEFELRVRGRIMQFDGYTKVLPPASSPDDDRALPDLTVGEALTLADVEGIQHFTRPPPRFGEASLVRELEKRGIGRPSTYAAIISTIQERGYVTLSNRRFHAEKIGELVTDRLVENFENLLDYGFTAALEEELDEIAEGNAEWRSVLNEFYEGFSARLAAAESNEGGMRANVPTDTEVACPTCGRQMQIRTGSTGVFLGCSGYALPPKERCTTTLNLIPGDDAVDTDADAEGESRLLRSLHKCPRCATPMTSFLIDETRKLHVCGNNPDCPGYEVEQGQFRIKGYDGPELECDRCGAAMQLKSGRFGKYFGCTQCKNTRKLLRSGEPAPPKADPVPMPELRCEKVDDHYLLRDGAAGIFLAASQFPKNRETRAPLVAELLPHANELDPKLRYLLEAPVADPDGRPAVVRFSRKSREQYVQSEEDGTATGWRAFYKNGRWVAETAAPAKAKPKPKAKSKAKAKRKVGTGRKPAGS
jgi:DNA topoisomerase-1